MASPPMAALEGLIHGGLENLQQKLPRSAEATYIHFSIFVLPLSLNSFSYSSFLQFV